MKISRENQHTASDIVLRALARGLCAVSIFDKRVVSDIKVLGDGFSFAVCAGPGKKSPAVKLKTGSGRFARADSDIEASDVVIRFKDISGFMPVLSARMSVASSFAQHRMLVSGNMNQAVTLVRVIEITQAYLFPKFMIKKAMRRVPKKRVPRIFIYFAMLFFGSKGPPRDKEAAEDTAVTDIAEVAAVIDATETAKVATKTEDTAEAGAKTMNAAEAAKESTEVVPDTAAEDADAANAAESAALNRLTQMLRTLPQTIQKLLQALRKALQKSMQTLRKSKPESGEPETGEPETEEAKNGEAETGESEKELEAVK